MSYTLSIILSFMLCGCSIAASHSSLKDASLPNLLPVSDFVANSKATGNYQVSPDGKKLAWIGPDGIHPSVFVKTLGRDDDKPIHILPRYYTWASDSRHLLIVSDRNGDENTHIYVYAIERPEAGLMDLTPFEKTVAKILKVLEGGPDIVVENNQRDKKVFDLFKINIRSGVSTVLATNPGDVRGWCVDRKGNLVARIRQYGDQHVLEFKLDSIGEKWKPTAEWTAFDSFSPLEVSDDGKSLLALSNRGRDKEALVQVDLETGSETVVYDEDDVDIDGIVISRKTLTPLTAYSNPGYPKTVIFDDRLRNELEILKSGKRAALYIDSADDQERIFTVSLVTEQGLHYYLYDLDNSKRTLLGEHSLTRVNSQLSSIEPVTFTSRDGLNLHGYLTLPVGVKTRQVPMVVLVHGGPWARDIWPQDGASMPQFLANRGYAVLQVNYRGSTGYGRTFMEKAIGEFAGKMHDDLIDGVNWAIKTSIADRNKIAIMGASYGGYASLVGLTFTPDVFACGIDIMGPSDLVRLLEDAPAYWELGKPWLYRYVGNPAKPEDRKMMDAKSPLYKAGDVTKPVLIMHGSNDPRVKLSQSQEMVAALEKAKKEVRYVVFSRSGHGTRSWADSLKMYREIEDFLSSCIGGRSSGFDFLQLFTWLSTSD